jgi:hypothetical protein
MNARQRFAFRRQAHWQRHQLNDSEYKIRALSFNQRVGADGEGFVV